MFPADHQAKMQARAFAVAQLREANPHLAPIGEGESSLAAAAKNIRIELKAAFPSIKFSVKTSRFSMGNSITVRWMDGPTQAQVDAIIDRYSAGSFDGMTDCYNYNDNAWTDAFGEAKYLHSDRDYSPAVIARCISTVFARYPGNMHGIARPNAEDYIEGRLWAVQVPGLNSDLQQLVSRELARRTLAIGRKTTSA